MLIEPIIEFELRDLDPLAVHALLQLVIFMKKTKISHENLPVDHYLLLKYCRRQCSLLPPRGLNHLQNLTPNCKISNVFWT